MANPQAPYHQDEPVDVPGNTREDLDPRGDLILVVGQRELLVSSRVLELSCLFFEKLLQCNAFSEGVEQPNRKQPPVKTIHEEHSETFIKICEIVHYRPVQPPESIDDYRLVADLCNFYGCSLPVSVHVRAWLDAWEYSALSSNDLQTLLWVTYVFHLRDQFQQVSLHLAKALSTSEWRAWEVHPMPAQLKDDMREQCQMIKVKAQRQIEAVIDEVSTDDERHISKRDKVCGQCFLNKPLATKKCGNCGCSDFHDYFCTREVRLLLLMQWLQLQGYWPLSRLDEQSCASFLGSMPFPAGGRTPCGFDNSCSLTGAKERLILSLRTILNSFAGLKLEDYHSEPLLAISPRHSMGNGQIPMEGPR
ncbi:uncharacterized protein A1O9_08941 [Exophiala aquamarina CBS 119918]|uniref:BTB domain-containing protein n=1 Tax=Exophiala aquamarina CBS 119918 TaxID=1182545 RepID=A0A072P6G9_9EURO|nr:uncharacterized protein A1O9_08941 [Exophiala aquamarina CBS 119918]KEF55287.1 hypothetical protein A1O9_08941 [Exophiala aquamarina CBS 119918]